MEKKKLLLIIIPLALVAVLLIGAAGIIAIGENSSNDYEALLLEAQGAYANGDYDAAIDAYTQAMMINDERPEAYEGMIDVYLAMGDPHYANYIAQTYFKRNGIVLTPDYTDRIDAALAELGTPEDEKDVSAETESITFNMDYLSFFVGATFEDYNNAYGNPQVERQGNTVRVSYASAPFVCTYGSVNGVVTFDANGKPFADSRPVSISMLDLGSLFGGMSGPVPLSVLKQEDVLAGAQVQGSKDSYYLLIEVNGCQIKVNCDESGTITDTDAWNEIVVTQESENVDICIVSGTVINAVNSKGVTNADVLIRAGRNSTSGSAVVEVTADFSGNYTVELEPGEYTVEVSASGYITEYFALEILSWYDDQKVDFVISPELATGEIRIVLEWGATPRDLDSHLGGRSSDGEDIHIYFGAISVPGVAMLDVDDLDGYGPETTTIKDINGSYEFWVHDYQETGGLGSSGATVKIYTSDGNVTTVEVPANASNRWDVCTISGGRVEILNQGDSSSAASTRTGITEEEAYQIACSYWGYTPGAVAPDTGFDLAIDSGGLIHANGRSYYHFTLRWLVLDSEDGSSAHWSAVDYLGVDAQTGECFYVGP